MKRLVVPAFALLLAAFVPAAASAQPTPQPQPQQQQSNVDVADAVTKVQAFYDQSQTFKSGFTQKFWVKAYNQTKDSRGTVIFSKPGKMHWTYADPQGNEVVSDGQNLKVYEAANKQMYAQTVDRSQYPAALSFLTGGGKLQDTFDFELFSGDRMHFPGGYVLVGTPKTPSPAYTKVLFYVDAQTSQVRRVMVIDGQGNRNRFDFLTPRINEQIVDTEFNFEPPAGTAIVRP